MTKALSLHSLGHWSAPDEGLREVHRVLEPGGTLVIGLRGEQASQTIEAALAGAGFVVTRPVNGSHERHAPTLLLATRASTSRAL